MTSGLRILLAGISLALAATQVSADPRPALVEIANLDCPYCREMGEHHERIERSARRAGVRFVYAPVPTDSSAQSAWRERVYYAAREIPGIERDLRRALLQTQDAPHPIRSLEQVTTWLDMTLPNVRWQAFVRDYVDDPESLAPIERSIRLAASAGVTSYPSFVFVSSQGVELIALRGTTTVEQADALVGFLESFE